MTIVHKKERKFRKGDVVREDDDPDGKLWRIVSVRKDRIRIRAKSGDLSLLSDEYGTFTTRPDKITLVKAVEERRKK